MSLPSFAGRPTTILAAKWRMLDNVARGIRHHLMVHLIVGVGTMGVLVLGGGVFFHLLFQFLMRQEPFGPPLVERLVGIVLLAFFSMLTFSNLIITLTTTYISKETEFLMALPLRPRHLFGVKLVESVFYSSWAFALLSLPLFASYGAAKSAPWWFYGWVIALGIPYIAIPAALGSTMTMVVGAWLPARKARSFSIVLLVSALALSALLARVMGLRTMIANSEVEDFSRIMGVLRIGTLPVLPNTWMARSMEAASAGHFGEAFYWWLILAGTAWAAVEFALVLAPWLYPRGWALARETGTQQMNTGLRRGGGVFAPFDALFQFAMPRPVASLLSKDLRTFWRDPAQWSQLVVLFALLAYYFSNLPSMTRELDSVGRFLKHWPTVLCFFNVGATCFVLSILTTRFVFPMLSLEGRQFWTIGLAPFRRDLVMWEKYLLCLGTALSVGVILVLYSNRMLRADTITSWMALGTVLPMALGLTSLAVGLGATFPNFREDNPARIANGLGGTVNVLLSMGYIIVCLAIQVPAVWFLADRLDAGRAAGIADLQTILLWAREAWWFIALWCFTHILAVYVPMRIGLRRWNTMEFHL